MSRKFSFVGSSSLPNFTSSLRLASMLIKVYNILHLYTFNRPSPAALMPRSQITQLLSHLLAFSYKETCSYRRKPKVRARWWQVCQGHRSCLAAERSTPASERPARVKPTSSQQCVARRASIVEEAYSLLNLHLLLYYAVSITH